mmetsp:Transcript_11683/g.26336  ORF Transcript_11683/g.26336 Transcript_11683/m.26336 type:complete len:85 (-) Transcript_11683:500-754(-)
MEDDDPSREEENPIGIAFVEDLGVLLSGLKVKAIASSNSSRFRETTHLLKPALLPLSFFLLSNAIAVYRISINHRRVVVLQRHY